MSQLVVAPVLAALVTAVLTALVRGRPRLRAGVSLAGGLGYLVAVAALFRAVAAEGRLTYQLSAWQAPFGISLVADALSTFMLGLAAVVALAGVVFAVRSVDAFAQRLGFHPLYHLMLVGVSGAFLTGDLFNLFVWFEVMLMASYVLVVLYGGPTQTRAALVYVVLNLIGSALMLVAIGGIYAVTGTLNLADIARRLADPAAFGVDVAPVLGLSALLFTVFALKAGLVPFHFWVPGAYRAAPAPVAAVLAGVVKKVGVYAVLRLYFTVFAAATLPVSLPGIGGRSVLAFYGPVLVVLALASIVVGGIAAVDRPDIDGLLAYSSVSQLGFVVLPLGVAAAVPELRVLAITATLVYTLNHGVAKALLFLVSGTLKDALGTDRFADLGGLAARSPLLGGAFFVGALSLVGVPPLIGFFGKLFVFDALGRAGADIALAGALVGALLTIAYASRAWNRAFWGPAPEAVEALELDRGLLAVVLALAALVVLLGLGAEPVLRAAEAGATAAVDRSGYVSAVLGGGA
ncbi:MAG: proton-conducting transporter membrane subunit [Halobacteriales archaeon]|nr:proton-conducting transporter membrane subunit [Halobacteriales archaeon]